MFNWEGDLPGVGTKFKFPVQSKNDCHQRKFFKMDPTSTEKGSESYSKLFKSKNWLLHHLFYSLMVS